MPPEPPEHATPQLVERALGGDRASLRSLLLRVAPIIQARASRALARRRGISGRDARQELMDMTQDVFVALLDADGRALRAWREDRGLSFENFVGLVADRQVASILRTGKRSPWTEDPTDTDVLEHHAGEDADEGEAIVSRDLLGAVLARLREELSPKMLHLFYGLWVDERPIPELSVELGMNAEAIYVARSRIAKRARSIAAELSASPSSSRMPEGKT